MMMAVTARCPHCQGAIGWSRATEAPYHRSGECGCRRHRIDGYSGEWSMRALEEAPPSPAAIEWDRHKERLALSAEVNGRLAEALRALKGARCHKERVALQADVERLRDKVRGIQARYE